MSAAAMLSGDAGGAAAAAGGGAAANEGGAAAGTGAAGTTTLSAVASTQQAAATAAWTDQITDPALKTYVTTKGWKDPAEIATGFMHLEKLLGSDKIPAPKGADDKEGWDRLYKAAGRPETPEGYKLPAPTTGDKGFVEDMAKLFHNSGLSVKQANDIAKGYSDYAGKITAAQADIITRRNEQELTQFKAEQGALFDAKLEMGRRAAKQFGFSNEELVAFEQKFGTKMLLTRFAAIGEALGEHSVTGEGAKGFGLNATQAQAQLDDLKKDKEFTAKYLSGDADAKARMFALQATAAGMTVEDYRANMGGRR